MNIHLVHSQRQLHTFAVLSTLPVTTYLPFISIELMKCKWAFSSFFEQRPLLRSQTLILLSSLTDNKNLPEGWKTKSVTQLSCPIRFIMHLPLLTSHNLMVLSLDPLAKKSFTCCGAYYIYFFSSSYYDSLYLRASLLAFISFFIFYIRSIADNCSGSTFYSS